MASTAILAIRIISDATNAAKGFQQTETSAAKMERRLGTASKAASVGLLALGAASISAAKDAASDAAAQAKLAFALRKNADASKAAIANTEAWISAQSRATGVADDQLRPALATLVRSTGSVTQSQAALKTAMDISAATGKPLETVSAALAKGYAGQTGAIGKLVPGLDKATLASGDMSKIMAELNGKVGGDAANAAKTAEGQYRILVNNFSEAKEELGAGLLPLLTQVAVVLADGAVWVQEHSKATKILVATFAGLAGAVVLVNGAYKAYQAAAAAVAVVQKVLNLAMRANPIGLIVTAIALLVAGLVLAYNKSETFRKIVLTIRDQSVAAFKQVWEWVGNVIDKISSLIGWVKRIKWPTVPKAISKLFGGQGGPPAGITGGGGGGGYAYSTLGGRGGPNGAGFLLPVAGGSGAQINNFYITGAVDPDSVARQIEGILAGRNRRLGRIG